LTVVAFLVKGNILSLLSKQFNQGKENENV
jgi:hypothetical protein